MDGGPLQAEVLDAAAHGAGPVVVLTGAGISAESGLPTFRGPEGFWRIGSRNHTPMEMATRAMFTTAPVEVWSWYLWRRTLYRAAAPNAAHRAIVRLEHSLGDRFRLVTQNVDGLHGRAGSSPERTWCVHGDIETLRCSDDCSTDLWSAPLDLLPWARQRRLTDAERRPLSCPRCDAWARPHVLWFDECYDEDWYRWESSIEVAAAADLLIVIGASGAARLPLQMAAVVAGRGGAIIDVDTSDNPFALMADALPLGLALRGSAADIVPLVVDRLSGTSPERSD